MEIIIRNVSKRFKQNTILEDVNLTLIDGHIYGFYGRNGSGKSVLLKMICDLYRPNAGEILFDGKNYASVTKMVPELRALIEKPNFFPDLSGMENLRLLAKVQNKISDKEIEEALKQVNLYEERNKRFGIYSLGMKQKLGIAQVIMENPKIMILDEPFNGVEEETVKKIKAYLLEEKKKGKIILFSTHILEDLTSMSDEIYYFDNKKVTRMESSNAL